MDEKERSIIIFLVSAVALIVCAWLLGNIGQERRSAEAQEIFSRLLPDSRTFSSGEISEDDDNVTGVRVGETGYVIETEVPGYVEDILVWTAVDHRGTVTGLVIREMHETMGLGRRALFDETFLRQFLGTAGYAQVGSGIDAITGATVTSKAVAKAVNSASAYVTGADAITEPTEWGEP